MATFISSLILYGFAGAVLGLVGKLIYDIQRAKKQPKPVEDWNEIKDKFQKLAGITEDDVQRGTEHLTEKIETLKKEFENSKFPPEDPSINVRTEKIYTVQTKFEDSDPLVAIPMSKVSKEGKQKMAEIAKEDINKQLEQNTEKFASIFPEAVEYTDEYYKSTLPNEIKEKMLKAVKKPATKKTTKKTK
jgi:tellurite resistance protein